MNFNLTGTTLTGHLDKNLKVVFCSQISPFLGQYSTWDSRPLGLHIYGVATDLGRPRSRAASEIGLIISVAFFTFYTWGFFRYVAFKVLELCRTGSFLFLGIFIDGIGIYWI